MTATVKLDWLSPMSSFDMNALGVERGVVDENDNGATVLPHHFIIPTQQKNAAAVIPSGLNSNVYQHPTESGFI